jgi:hypothetical protein
MAKVDLTIEGTDEEIKDLKDKIAAKQADKSNSPEKLEKVISGEIVKKKKSSAIASEFVKEEPSYVRDYILGEIILPAVKNTIADIVKNATDLFLFGEVSGNRSRNDRTGYSRRSRDDRDFDRPRDRRRYSERRYDDFSDIVMTSRADATMVLNDLRDQIEDYGYATVANFYELVGEDSGHNDVKYGWESLDRAYVESVRGGYIIVFPRARYLD